MTGATRTAAGIIADVVSAVAAETGYPVPHVQQFVVPATRYLLREYGGDRLPKVTRTYPEADIRAAVDGGMSLRKVCRKFGIGTGTLYRILDASTDP